MFIVFWSLGSSLSCFCCPGNRLENWWISGGVTDPKSGGCRREITFFISTGHSRFTLARARRFRDERPDKNGSRGPGYLHRRGLTGLSGEPPYLSQSAQSIWYRQTSVYCLGICNPQRRYFAKRRQCIFRQLYKELFKKFPFDNLWFPPCLIVCNRLSIR